MAGRRGIAILMMAAMAATAGALSAGAAHADSSTYGVFFPEDPAMYNHDTGIQTAQIRITAASPLVGASVPIDFTLGEASGIKWFAGLSVSGEPGGSCAQQSSSGSTLDWTCTPGPAGWAVGQIVLSVNTETSKTDCTLTPSAEIWVCGEDLVNFGGPDAPSAGASPSSDGQSWGSGFAIGIVLGPAPCQMTPPPCSASVTAAASATPRHSTVPSPVAASVGPAGRAATGSSASAGRSSASAGGSPSALRSGSSSPSASGPTSAAPAAAQSAPAAIDAAPVANSSGGSGPLEIALPILIAVLAAAFIGWRLSARRRRTAEPDERDGQGSADD